MYARGKPIVRIVIIRDKIHVQFAVHEHVKFS